MADAEEPKPEEIVKWEDTRKLAEDIDKLLIERIAEPRKQGDDDTELRARDRLTDWTGEFKELAGAYKDRDEKDYWVSDSYNAPGNFQALLCTDVTTPFPVKFPCDFGVFKAFPNARIFQRYEFAYYNTGPHGEYLFKEIDTPVKEGVPKYERRYYWDNTRQPVMTASYISWVSEDRGKYFDEPLDGMNMLDREKFHDMFKEADVDSTGRLVYNLAESHRHALYKQWPVAGHCSSESTISSELFFVTEPGFPFACASMLRLSPVGSDDGKCHNGNFNAKPKQCTTIANGKLIERPYRAHRSPTRRVSTPVDGDQCWIVYTFANRRWDSYVPDFHSYTSDPAIDDTRLYTMPPICSGCQDPALPYIGLEGGTKAWRDGSNWGTDADTLNYNNVGDRPTDLWSDNVFHPAFTGAVTKPYTPVVDWDPAKKVRQRIPSTKLGRYKLRLMLNRNPELKRDFMLRYKYCKEGYRKYWCHPEDLDYYEKVSKYEVWRINHKYVVVRVTPIRFRKKSKPVKVNGKWKRKAAHYDFVWVPTAFNIQVKGKFIPAIRKRWYDMMSERLRYLCGYWVPAFEIADEMKCTDTESHTDYKFTTEPWPAQKVQRWNGMDDERLIDTYMSSDSEEILYKTEIPCWKKGESTSVAGGLESNTHEVARWWEGFQYINMDMPVGVTWDYDCETVWNPLDMQCARWLAEGPETTGSTFAPGWEPDTPGVSVSCGAYFGTRYWDSMIATLNVVGNSIDDNNYELTFSNADAGLCTRLDEKHDGCSEPFPETFDDPLPWWGGCANTVCTYIYEPPVKRADGADNELTRVSPAYNVHAFTLQMLRRLVTFLQKHKHIEQVGSGWVATDDWKACSPDFWETPDEYKWDWVTQVYTEYTETVDTDTPDSSDSTYSPDPSPEPTITPWPGPPCPCDEPWGLIPDGPACNPNLNACRAQYAVTSMRLYDGYGQPVAQFTGHIYSGPAVYFDNIIADAVANGGNGVLGDYLSVDLSVAGQEKIRTSVSVRRWQTCGGVLEWEITYTDGNGVSDKHWADSTSFTECDEETTDPCPCDDPKAYLGEVVGDYGCMHAGVFRSWEVHMQLRDANGNIIEDTQGSILINPGSQRPLNYPQLLNYTLNEFASVFSFGNYITMGDVEGCCWDGICPYIQGINKQLWDCCGATLLIDAIFYSYYSTSEKQAFSETLTLECDPPLPPGVLPKARTAVNKILTVAQALPQAAALLEATGMALDEKNTITDCKQWHEEDHGTWKGYWCNMDIYGDGQLSYEKYRLLSGCYAGEEQGWAGKVDVFLPTSHYPGQLRSAEKPNPPKAGEKWWTEDGDHTDYVIVRVACTSHQPATTGMIWCPYLLAEGRHEIKVEIMSPLKRGPRGAGQNAVRGWVEGYCEEGPYDCDKRTDPAIAVDCVADPAKYATTDEDAPGPEFSVPCPRLTDMNPGGGMFVTAWHAGWTPDVLDIGAGTLKGNGTCEGYEEDLYKYLDEAFYNKRRNENYLEFSTLVNVGGNSMLAGDIVKGGMPQYRGYIGLTINMGAFSMPGRFLPGEYDNVEKYVYCPHDEYLLVAITSTPLDVATDENE